MKFDLHNLPFLAGGSDYTGSNSYSEAGFCPGLYFLKKAIEIKTPYDPYGNLIKVTGMTPTINAIYKGTETTQEWCCRMHRYNRWPKDSKEGRFVEACCAGVKSELGKIFHGIAPEKAGLGFSKWREWTIHGIPTVKWILAKPLHERCEYVSPCCNQEFRYPNFDYSTGIQILSGFTGDNTGLFDVASFLNYTYACKNYRDTLEQRIFNMDCEDCNYVPDRWNENQFQLFCPSSPNEMVKEWINTPMEPDCLDATSQTDGIITHWNVTDGIHDTKIRKSPDHWMYICQNPKDTCLDYRTYDSSLEEKEKAMGKLRRWRPPCYKWNNPITEDYCLIPYMAHWRGDINSFNRQWQNLRAGAHFTLRMWENPMTFGGDPDSYPSSYTSNGLCGVDANSYNPYGANTENYAAGQFGCRNPYQTQHRLYDDWPDTMRCYIDWRNEVQKVRLGIINNLYDKTTMSVTEINDYLLNNVWLPIRGGKGPIFLEYDNCSLRCQELGFFGLHHLFIPGQCAGWMDLASSTLWTNVLNWLNVHGTLPPDVPHEKYCCSYDTTWFSYHGWLGGTKQGAPVGKDHGKVKFCAFGPEYAVGTDGSLLYGGWFDKCKKSWDEAEIYKYTMGCEDRQGLQYRMPWECMSNPRARHEGWNPHPTASIARQGTVNLCAPCDAEGQISTISYSNDRGLFFVPMPPTGLMLKNGCAQPVEVANNYRLRWEQKVYELAPLKDFPRSMDTYECDQVEGDILNHKLWRISTAETKTRQKVFYSGDFSDMITDHGSGVFLTGIAITNNGNINNRKTTYNESNPPPTWAAGWWMDNPIWYELRDVCNVAEVIPRDATFIQYTNHRNLEGTNNGKNFVIYKPKTRLGPFITDTKVCVDYYMDHKYIAQSNWICFNDYFMITLPPPNKTSRSPLRTQSFHGASHVITHVASKNNKISNTKGQYWFMKWMENYHCMYDDAYNGGRIADLYFQSDGIQYEFSYGLCNILTGSAT